ncbi:dTDP-4-dehydrorhamnose 3,5-epimerase family protein [Candidatus Pelagibacter sp. HIMB1506]|uniref:dTDP-4-dehydrorhamnose 3,5-epimerase family protein n=1 Tax=Candidatus Pelagibacter sp. HIMB1506 TaxID=3413337 RepID=UPI003F828588
MKIKKTKFKNTFIIQHKKNFDNRGFFMRSFCDNELKKAGISFKIRQTNLSFNKKNLTLRGFHFQKSPYSEDKIITCLKGKLLLVLLDLNKKSKTYLNHIKIILSESLNESVLVSKTCATAFLTLKSNTLVSYYMTTYYKKNKGSGINYKDPKLKIKWTKQPKVISKRDANFSFLS